MNNLNSIVLEGKIENELIFNETLQGAKFAIMKMIVENCSETSIIEVDMKESMANSFKDYLLKDTICRVVGRIHQFRWTDTSGKKHAKISIFAEHIEVKK